ncbi:amylo-alpha-1,6-glucosidase [Paenibacillus xerothermodurans]|uniref:Amylo-alpha-1,6-glucosidase n=1 Tax=Paenibacillus xerothermodurans TaxID=1977292 RepID=A0A2W1NBU4_PAEXE|nr:amylo-alpha-1,6-glucosidase [Paenibacillus xerothermodurans]PZE21120.1 amylo-alpha-1,6-glucosidase [Paenibacillus xerothermodurans]
MDYRVIKENDLFLLTDSKGNIPADHPYGLGLYTKDTRFLSRMDLRINGIEPILLSSDAAENYMAKIVLTNAHMELEGELVLWRESIEIERTRFIYDDVLYESVQMTNYYPKPVQFEMSIHMDVDFADMFAVRGFQTAELGKRTGQTLGARSITYHYAGADEVKRATVINWDKPHSSASEDGDVAFQVALAHGESYKVTFRIQPHIGEMEPRQLLEPDDAVVRLQRSYDEWQQHITAVQTDHGQLQQLVERGLKDLKVLLTNLGHGSFPVAGLPWFGVPFGRDSLIAALQMLPFNPAVAKGTLRTMAAKQGQAVDAWRDEQPGKIMHEIRFGEMAGTNQVPFTPYYGTIDATPLFLIVMAEYVRWSGDTALALELLPNIERALQWIDEYGDRDGDLFVEYHQESSKGIANQGWKDSGDSIVHRNGEYAVTPIALSEVQGYVYQAKMGIAELYQEVGFKDRAERLRSEAQALKAKFDEAFWMEEHRFYAIALDENKRQVGTITSNPGHLLLSGMLDEDRADAVADCLLSPQMFSGYGIRTMGAGEAGYNPMSYHDGSIWPHDNSMIILGLSKYGRQAQANTVIAGLIDAADHFEYERLPELFCGYDKARGRAVPYPVACSPQAWAAGTPLVFVQSLLGLFADSLHKRIQLSPTLLDGMNVLQVDNIAIGGGRLSVRVERADGEIRWSVPQNTTGFEIVTA